MEHAELKPIEWIPVWAFEAIKEHCIARCDALKVPYRYDLWVGETHCIVRYQDDAEGTLHLFTRPV